MAHLKFNKIYALGKEEVEGILDGEVIIQEKIDGANASVWIEGGSMKFGSRNQQVVGFQGFPEYCTEHQGITQLLIEKPNYRLYGEWLVKHSIQYNETAYRHFYLFDILNEQDGIFLEPQTVAEIAEHFGIKSPKIFFQGKVDNIDDVKSLWVGKSELGPEGEGVVIKRFGFVNKFGTTPQYAKIVTQAFKEQNAAVFGGNNKHSETYWEQYVSNEFMTLARVQKCMQKIESAVDRPLELKDTPRVVNSCYNDMLTEEIWTIQKKVPNVNFKTLSRICMKKAEVIYKDLLNGNDLSVAYK